METNRHELHAPNSTHNYRGPATLVDSKESYRSKKRFCILKNRPMIAIAINDHETRASRSTMLAIEGVTSLL